MLRGILWFEWRYAVTRVTFAACAAVLGLLGFVLAKQGFGAMGGTVNSPYAIAYATGFLSMVAVVVVTVLVAPSLLRDSEHHMAELVYATAVTKTQYLVGRFVGSLLAAVAALGFGFLGMVAGTVGQDPERLGPFSLASYAWALGVMGVPSLLFVGALLFAVAVFTRSTLATYVGGVAVYLLYFVSAILTRSPLLAASGPTSPQELAIAAMADPFGLAALFEQGRYWTAIERSSLRPSLSGSMLANRAAWSAAGLLLLALAHRVFAFRVVPAARGKAPMEDALPAIPTAYRPIAVSTRGTLQVLGSVVKLEVLVLLKSWPFLALLLLWIGTASIELVEELRRGEFGTALLPTGGLILRHLERPYRLFGLLVIVYFTAETVWRERKAGVAELVDATPVSSAVFIAGKTAALVGALLGLALVAVAVGVTLQLALGHRPLELSTQLALLWLGGLPLALFAVLAVCIQTLAPNRFAGMLVTLLLAVVFPLGGPGAPEHPLLQFASLGTVQHSELNGFGPGLRSFHALAAYWTAFTGVIAFAGYALWRRGTDSRLWARLRTVQRRVGRRALIVGAMCAIAFLVIGGVLAVELRNAGYRSTPERLAWQARYERTYGGTAGRPQPSIRHLALTVDLFPEQRRYVIHGVLTLVNSTGEPISEVHATVDRGLRTARLTLDGQPAQAVDERFGVHAFAASLPPGAEAKMELAVEVDRSGWITATEHDLVENGSFVFLNTLLPALGYQRRLEISDEVERRRSGLPVRRPRSFDPPNATFDVTVTAPADQLIAGPGLETALGEMNGRRATRFHMDRPVVPALMFSAARYALSTGRPSAAGVAVELLHHPTHTANVQRILDATTASLDYLSESFGPYPFDRLRIAEVTSYDDRFGGFAVPGLVFFTEDRGFLTDTREEGRVDLVTKRTAHEVAHQWWGHQATPGNRPGASAIVETLARYSELMILRRIHGPHALRPVLQVELQNYLRGRTGEDEVPLEQVEDQTYLSYAKGALVMTALADLIGEEQVNKALRAFLVEAKIREPTVQDLMAQLRAVTPPQHQDLFTEWWTQTILYDFRVVSAQTRPRADGRHELTVRVAAERWSSREGKPEPLPLNDEIRFEAYANYPTPGAGELPLFTTQQRLTGEREVTWLLDAAPAYVAVDPDHHRIDRNPDDNLRKVEAAP